MKVWMTSLAFVVLSCSTGAAEMDKQRLRQLAEMPDFKVIIGLGFSSTKGIIYHDEKTEPARTEIARIRKAINGDASDAERYVRLGSLYAEIKRKKDASYARARAVALFQQQVKKYPRDRGRLVQLAEALCYVDEAKESETLLRRAAKEAPDDWRIWVGLGQCVDFQACRAILGHTFFAFSFADEEALHPHLFDKKPNPEQIAEWRRLRGEVSRCYDRAIELAPREIQPYMRRIISRYWHGIFETGLRNVQGDRVSVWDAILIPAFVNDMRQIARLSPNDPKNVGAAVAIELMVGMRDNNNEAKEPKGSSAGSHAESNRDFVRWGMARLEQLTKKADKRTAALASVIVVEVRMMKLASNAQRMLPGLCNVEWSQALPKSEQQPQATLKEGFAAIALGLEALGFLGQAEKDLRRAVQFDPTFDHAWDSLTKMLVECGQFVGASAVCEQRLKIKDNAHNRYLLAYCSAGERKYDKAAEHLHDGISKDKDDLNCRLGLIALLLWHEDAESLKQAGEQLDAAESIVQEARSKSRTAHYRLLRGLHVALSDQRDRARELFQDILRQDTSNTSAAKALASLGIPATPADESLAIAYLTAHKADVGRADKRPDSPVVKICLNEDNSAAEDRLFFLSAFPQLRELRVCSDSITDDGLIHLERLTALRRLDLNCPYVTDAGLTHLHPLKRMKTVNLQGAQVTEKGIADLRKTLPKLDISR